MLIKLMPTRYLDQEQTTDNPGRSGSLISLICHYAYCRRQHSSDYQVAPKVDNTQLPGANHTITYTISSLPLKAVPHKSSPFSTRLSQPTSTRSSLFHTRSLTRSLLLGTRLRSPIDSIRDTFI